MRKMNKYLTALVAMVWMFAAGFAAASDVPAINLPKYNEFARMSPEARAAKKQELLNEVAIQLAYVELEHIKRQAEYRSGKAIKMKLVGGLKFTYQWVPQMSQVLFAKGYHDGIWGNRLSQVEGYLTDAEGNPVVQRDQAGNARMVAVSGVEAAGDGIGETVVRGLFGVTASALTGTVASAIQANAGCGSRCAPSTPVQILNQNLAENTANALTQSAIDVVVGGCGSNCAGAGVQSGNGAAAGSTSTTTPPTQAPPSNH